MHNKKNNKLEYKTHRNFFFSSIVFQLAYYHFGNLTHKLYIALFKEYTLVGGCGV